MTSRIIPVAPFVVTVFGATGDLARRKLLPALFHRDRAAQLPEQATIVGVARSMSDTETFREQARKAILEHVPETDPADPALLRFLSRLLYVMADAASEQGWNDLIEVLAPFGERVMVYYLATAPHLIGPVCEKLGRFGLARANARVVLEKPIGKDLASAMAVNDAVGAIFPEASIYRIDHYLGKETVQNLMALRFANTMFEPVWNAAHIDHVQITVAETLGVEQRAGYYDSVGAMRDMIQNHLLQLLCLVAIEPPPLISADAVRDEKLKVLRALKPIDARNAASFTVRGQYCSGASAGGALSGYLEDIGKRGSVTETFVALRAEVGNWRWAGVPFYLRTGKRLAARVSEIVIGFKPVPHSAFGEQIGAIRTNRLVIRLQPDEGVKLWLMIKDPGPGGMRLSHVPLDMSFSEAFKVRNPDAYERLILDVVRGDQTLFMRRDEVEAAWRWIDPILEAWRDADEPPRPYAVGTWGPSAAVAMIEREGRTWQDEDGA